MNSSIQIKDINLENIIVKKEGYEIKKVIMTTYSFEKALLIPIACIMDDDIELKDVCDGKSDDDILFALDKMCEEDKLLIFYQQNKLMGGNIKKFFLPHIEKLMNKSGKAVSPATNTAFHPKIILIFYHKDNEYLCRLSVASRNITLSNSLEAVAISEVTINDTDFDPNSIDGVEILAGFINDKFDNVFFQTQEDKESKIIDKMKGTGMFDNYTCLDVISPGFMMKDINGLEFTPFYKDNNHSKVYLFSKGDDSEESMCIWMGSANCSGHGLGLIPECNYECMHKVDVNIKRDDLIALLNENGFINDSPKYEDSDSDTEIEGLINNILGNAKIIKENEQFFLQFEGNCELNNMEAFIEIFGAKIRLVDNQDKYEIRKNQLSRYIIICLINSKKELQCRTINVELGEGVEDEYKSIINDACNNNLLKHDLLIKGINRKNNNSGSEQNGASGTKRIISKSKLLSENGIFENILALKHQYGSKGINREITKIKRFKKENLLDKDEADKILGLLEALKNKLYPQIVDSKDID